MTLAVANVSYANTFSHLVGTVNKLSDALTNIIVTTNGVSGAATGNAHIIGYIFANNGSFGDLTVSNTATVGGTLAVTGAASFANTLSITGSEFVFQTDKLKANSTVFSVKTPTFNVNDLIISNTTHLSVNGTANVVGAVALANTLAVAGAVTISNTLAAGNTTLARLSATTTGLGNTTITGFINVSSTAQIGGAVTIANTLSTGNTTVAGFANVTGTGQFGGAVTIANTLSTGNTTVAGTLSAGATGLGNTTVTGTLAAGNTSVGTLAAGNTTVAGTLAAGNSSLEIVTATGLNGPLGAQTPNTAVVTIFTAANTTVNGFINVSSTGQFGGAVTIANTLSAGNTSVAGTLAAGNTIISGTLAAGNTSVGTLASGNLTVTGLGSVTGNIANGAVLTVTNSNGANLSFTRYVSQGTQFWDAGAVGSNSASFEVRYGTTLAARFNRAATTESSEGLVFNRFDGKTLVVGNLVVQGSVTGSSFSNGVSLDTIYLQKTNSGSDIPQSVDNTVTFLDPITFTSQAIHRADIVFDGTVAGTPPAGGARWQSLSNANFFELSSDLTNSTAGSLILTTSSGNIFTIGSTGNANFAGSVTATSFVGNASTATTIQTARTIAISGPITGTATSFNGSTNITIPVTALNVGAAEVTGTLAVARGGTGIASYTTGNFLRASGATTLEQRTAAQVLSDIGAAAASHTHAASDITSGTLAVVRGGTGVTTSTGVGSVVLSTSPTLSFALADRPEIRAYRETKSDITATATTTLDLNVASVFVVTLNTSITTLSINNTQAGLAVSFVLRVVYNATTARTIAWPAAVKWTDGTAPTLTCVNGKADHFVFTTTDGGTTWYAFVAAQNQ